MAILRLASTISLQSRDDRIESVGRFQELDAYPLGITPHNLCSYGQIPSRNAQVQKLLQRGNRRYNKPRALGVHVVNRAARGNQIAILDFATDKNSVAMLRSFFGKMGDHADSSIRLKLMSHLEARQLFTQFLKHGDRDPRRRAVLLSQ